MSEKKKRVAKIYLTVDAGEFWQWRFYDGVRVVERDLSVTMPASYVIAQATRTAKRYGFDDARVVDVEIKS